MTKLYSPRKLRIGIYTTKNNKIENKQIPRWLLLVWLLLGWLLLRWLLLSIITTLNKSKKLTAKLPWKKPDAYAFFCLRHCLMSPALHPGFSDLGGSPPALSSTPILGFFFVFECIDIQFFNSLTCDLRDAMPRKRSLTLIPREAEDLPRGDNHSKHALLPTYLAWLQPIHYNSRFAFIHAKTTKILLVVKTLIKKHRAEAKLISSHKNIE